MENADMKEYICVSLPIDYEWDGGYESGYLRKGELIRCKDCKHYRRLDWSVGGGYYVMCRNGSIANAFEDDFCSWAERKE